ncbi:hypothetical protein NVS55_04150 [Myxococcus stipitatus]|uniref:hypothetical protein n=1 Tax=Myxococcus stipitatus TaxID=83455 RepID=UPI0031451005
MTTWGSSLRVFVMMAATLSTSACVRPWRATFAPPEEALKVEFPEWKKEGTIVLDGITLRALQIAAEDFIPVGTTPPEGADAKTICQMRWESFDTWIRRGERVTFIHFSPIWERCGVTRPPVDGGADYAISDDGIILRRE